MACTSCWMGCSECKVIMCFISVFFFYRMRSQCLTWLFILVLDLVVHLFVNYIRTTIQVLLDLKCLIWFYLHPFECLTQCYRHPFYTQSLLIMINYVSFMFVRCWETWCLMVIQFNLLISNQILACLMKLGMFAASLSLSDIHFSFPSLGMKDSWGPLKALAVASVVNGIGDIVLCSFLGYGIAGAAWATMASQVC